MALTPVLVCGYECGATIGAAGTHVQTIGGTAPTFSTTTRRAGLRSLRFNPSAATSTYQLDTIIGNTNRDNVYRFYIYFASFPTADTFLLSSGVFLGTVGGVGFQASDHTLRPMSFSPNTFGTANFVVNLSTWYCVDLHVVSSSNPWTIDVRVNGTALTQLTKANVAANQATIFCGMTTSGSADMFWDDLMASFTAADYPIGEGTVEGVSPNRDGTHSFTAGDFRYGDAGGNVATSATDVNTKLSDVPVGSGTLASDSIEQIVLRATSYVEVQFPPNNGRGAPQGVEVIVAHHESTTGLNSQIHKLRDNNGATEDAFLTIAAAAGVVTQRYARKCYAVIPGGTAWTTAAYDKLVYRGLFSGNVTSVPKVDGVLLEVAFPPDTSLEWQPQTSEPVRQPPYPVPEGAFDGLDRQDDTVVADASTEWWANASEPVRTPPRAVDEGAFELRDLQTLQEDTELEWWQNANEPQRQPPYPVGEGLFALEDRAGELQEDTFLEWLQQLSEPRREIPRPVDEGAFVMDSPSDLQEDTFLEWWLNANEPVRLFPRAVDEGTFVTDPHQLGLTEDTFLEWLQALAEPVRTPPRPVDEGAFAAGADNDPVSADVSIEWQPQTSEPVRVAPSPVGEGFLILGNIEGLTEDTFLEWWLNANEPVRTAPRPVDEGAYQQPHPESLQEDTEVEWLQPLSEPQRQPARAVDEGLSLNPDLESLQQDTFLEWLQQTAEPVRIPGRLVDEGLFLIDFSALAQPTDTFLSWWRQTEEPVRTPPYLVAEGIIVIGDLDIPIPAPIFRSGTWGDVRPVGLLVRPADRGVRPH